MSKGALDEINECSIFHKDESWIYYTDTQDNIYKIRLDGTDKQKLNDDTSLYPSLTKDWIYYLDNVIFAQLIRIRTDGTERKMFIDEAVRHFKIEDNYLYYVTDNNYSLYKIKTDGTEKKEMCSDTCSGFYLADGWIYYTTMSGSKNIYKMRTDGTEQQKLGDDCNCDDPYVSDGWVYYTVHGDICKIRIDGTEAQGLNVFALPGFTVSDGWIYYEDIDTMDEGRKKYRIRTDGSEKQELI